MPPGLRLSPRTSLFLHASYAQISPRNSGLAFPQSRSELTGKCIYEGRRLIRRRTDTAAAPPVFVAAPPVSISLLWRCTCDW